jgi:HEAT repeat protein
MYTQENERKAIIRELYEMGTPEAVDVLLDRFKETSHNTTVDIDEKEYVYDVLVKLARNSETDVEGKVLDYLRETDEKVNWPMKVLKDLYSYEEMAECVTDLLETADAGYQSDPEKKQELMLQAAEVRSEDLCRRLLPFLEDGNETIRFLAVDAVAHQEFEQLIREPLVQRLYEEDSLRIVKKIAKICAKHSDWKIPEDKQADVEKALPDEYGIHKEGHVYKRRV